MSADFALKAWSHFAFWISILKAKDVINICLTFRSDILFTVEVDLYWEN